MKNNELDPRSGLLGDEEVGELIRSSGQRPEIPAEDLSTIKAATRSAWEETLQAGRRRRHRLRGMYALAAGVVLGLLGIWWWQSDTAPLLPQRIATLQLLRGRVEVARAETPGESVEVVVGDVISSGAILLTASQESASAGRAALLLAGGQSLRLDAGTRIRFVSPSRLELEQGALYVDSGPSVPQDADLQIGTPLGTVREIGTQYEIRLADAARSVRVRVREGSVSVSRNGDAETAERGEQLILEHDGTTTRGTVETDGPEWQWVLAAAPAIEIEGQSLGAFLDWASRETGWEIRFADEDLEASAGAILLHGTIDGLRPNESIGVILQGSGLDYRVEDGTVLVIRP